MNYFCKNVIFFVFVQAIAITLLIDSSSCEPNKGHRDDINALSPWFLTWHVHAINGLSNSKLLLVHCKSKDDDLGIHSPTIDTEFTWKFKPNFFGGHFSGATWPTTTFMLNSSHLGRTRAFFKSATIVIAFGPLKMMRFT